MESRPSHNISSSILYRACLLFSRVGFFAALACLCYWVLYFGSRFYSEDKYWALSETELLYGCKDSLLAPSCAAQELVHYNVVFLWLAPTVLAIAATAILILQPLASQTHNSTGKVWLQRLLPPRAFWLYWCEGLTVQDALLVTFWAATNAVWLSAILNRSFETLLPRRLEFYHLQYPTHSVRAKSIARAFGALLAPNLVMLFYPVSRGSVVLQALNISYPAAIRYHRWLGHATLTFVLLHGGMYWSAFLYDGVWVDAALSRDEDVNHLMGSIGFVFAMCLWLSALDVVRRRSYTVFKTMHHIGFWGFLVFGCCHYWGLVWNFLPGLMLYAVDAVYRLHQFALGVHGSEKSNSQSTAVDQPAASDSPHSRSSNSQFKLSHFAESNNSSSVVRILHADVSPDGSMCSLILHIPQFAAAANGFIWLCVPDINWFAYHPFTYVAVPWQVGRVHNAASAATTVSAGECLSSVTAVVLHIKGYNRWTRKLVALVGDRGINFSVRVQGPYAELPGPVTGHNATTSSSSSNADKQKQPDAVVVVAGGNGVTEAFSVLSELSVLPPGLPVLLIWSSRARGELECLTPRVLSMAQAAGVHLRLKLYYTGSTSLLLKESPPNSPTAEFSDLTIRVNAAPSSNFSAYEGSFLSTTTSNNPTLSTLNSASCISESSCSISDPAEASSPTVVEGLRAQTRVDSSQMDSVPAVAANDGCGGNMETSSLCPVVALGSYWSTAWYKMILHVVMLTGAFCALMLARYLTIMLPSYPLPTDQMGAIHVGLVIAFMLIPGFIILWVTLLIRKRRSKLSGQHHSSNTQHVWGPGVGACAPAVGTASAAAAAMAGTIQRRVVAKLLSNAPTSPLKTKAGKDIGVDSRSHLQLLVPHKSSPTVEISDGTVVPVEIGRAPTPPLVKGWLASIQQLPKAVVGNTSTNDGIEGDDSSAGSTDIDSATVNCVVYAMGPPTLVAGVQMLCDDVHRCGKGARKQNIRLSFVRKTHEF